MQASVKHVNNNQKPRDIANLLRYEPIYRHIIPHHVARLTRLILPPLCICEPTKRAQHSDSDDLSQYFNDGVAEFPQEFAQ